MNPKSAIAKGKELEEWVVNRLKVSDLDIRARRTPGSGNGKEKGDISNDLGICFECKNTKKAPNKATFAQVAREAMGYQKEVIVWHMPQTSLEESIVVIRWDYFEELLKKTKEPTVINPDRATAYKIKRLIQSAKDILKEFDV